MPTQAEIVKWPWVLTLDTPVIHSVSYFLIQDINVADVENEISHTQLQKLHVTSRLKGLQQSLDEMNVSAHQQNELISKSEGLITKNNALIERKQTQIDQMNKKIDHKLSSVDGVSLQYSGRW